MRILAAIILLSTTLCGCGSIGPLHNPYQQTLTEAIAPDMLEVVAKRNNETDDWGGTDVRLRWILK